MSDPSVVLTAPGVSLTLMLDDTPPSVEGGFANIEEVERLDRAPITNWKGPTLKRMKVPVLCDGLADDADQQPLIDGVLALAMTTSEPTELTATGPLPLPNRQWWLESVSWGDSNRNAAGVLVRQALVLALVEPVDPDILPTALKAGGASGGAASGTPKTYTTKKGDTLYSIAVKIYGLFAAQAGKAKEIAKLNNLRDTTKALKAGIVLRLPPS